MKTFQISLQDSVKISELIQQISKSVCLSTAGHRYKNIKGGSFYLCRRNLIEEPDKNLYVLINKFCETFVANFFSKFEGGEIFLVLSGMLLKQKHSIWFK